MDWNEAAEQLLDQILMSTPLPVRRQIETHIRTETEAAAEAAGRSRVSTNELVAGWVGATPEALRGELPRQMERLGLDPEEFEYLFPA
jgi:hypothetical protein